MQRKTAVAAASAISMSLASAAIAIGASFGALGFASASPAPSAQPAAVSAPAAGSTPGQITSSARGGAGEHEHEGSTTGAAVTTTRATYEKGNHSDD
jgi:hypothetical protein